MKPIAKSDESGVARQSCVPKQASIEPVVPDNRSPLERFRTKPRKTLSVTDLISPAWCELQYWYTLTKYGRKKRTSAMSRGSTVHKILEDTAHQTVPIDVSTKEDAWGLRIWNVIQGLRTLRETGIARELEVWGIVDGLVVNGVIDEVSLQCPDQDLEDSAVDGRAHGMVPKEMLPVNQKSIREMMVSPHPLKETRHSHRLASTTDPKVFLTDVKTRGSKTVPKGPTIRPTLMQLMLYRCLLSNLASNQIDAAVLFARYDLDADAVFSDAFLAQLSGLNGSCDATRVDLQRIQEGSASTQDSMEQVLNHNSLHRLWGLMMSEFQYTMPSGKYSIGNVLKVEYRDQSEGSIIGFKTFLHDQDVIDGYIQDQMKWWQGKREAQGVAIEEAYKCRICEFSKDCTWRKAKVDDAVQAHRTRLRATA